MERTSISLGPPSLMIPNPEILLLIGFGIAAYQIFLVWQRL
jgi:hypothetical protein